LYPHKHVRVSNRDSLEEQSVVNKKKKKKKKKSWRVLVLEQKSSLMCFVKCVCVLPVTPVRA